MSGAAVSRISGPAVEAKGVVRCFMGEVVRIGSEKLIGEVIRIENDLATIQVYEETIGLRIGDPVEQSGELFAVELGPGLMGSIFDGVQRPLTRLLEGWGDNIRRGGSIHRLDRKKRWEFEPAVRVGDMVEYGSILGFVRETRLVTHKIMTPARTEGVVAEVKSGGYTISDPVVILEDGTGITMKQQWNIRHPRPKAERVSLTSPLVTGQRIIDSMFPVAEGGVAIIPGGFGAGKTVLEQTIAKFSHADIVIYIGCGERGNEMADTLDQLTTLTDPSTGDSLMDRTILIANTSNMPVAAREASIYTGITVAEYYRDMGYKVLALADSTSRWAEALREISSRLEEIPGEEGYPTYLVSRLGAFYERAGKAKIAGRKNQTGSITIVGAVSPPGGDFSEPVTQASLRLASTFWGLDSQLAYQRHFPAINWSISFSLAYRDMAKWYMEKIGKDWPAMIDRTMKIMAKEEELSEIVKIVGIDSLEDKERLTLEAGRLIREGYFRQSAVHPVDAYCSISKQAKILAAFLEHVDAMKGALDRGAGINDMTGSAVSEKLLRLKESAGDTIDEAISELRVERKKLFKSLETQ